MRDMQSLGFQCRCGAIVPIPGLELAEGESIEEKRHKLMLEGWRGIAVHAGCGEGGVKPVLTPAKLILVPSSQ